MRLSSQRGMQISGKIMKRNLFLQANNFFDLIAVKKACGKSL